MNLPRAAAAIALLPIAFARPASSKTVLYETDFETFTVGDDNLSGTDGWVSTHDGEALHGIGLDDIPGLGNSAFLGFNPPASTSTQTVTVLRPINYDAVAEDNPLVEFEAVIAIADSRDDPDTEFIDESNRRDRFLITVYNIAGNQLASIIYDNRSATFGLYRNDGLTSFDSGFEFVVEEAEILYFSIDFENNTWSASLDGAPLFTDAQFNSTGQSRTLGAVAAEWLITNPLRPGDNWMLFDDFYIAARARDTSSLTEPFTISKVEQTIDEKIELTYPADEGCTYTVQYSTDLKSWTDLPNSPVTAIESDPAAKHTDNDPADEARFYRILRSAED